jgi:hypothetical protein
VVLARHQWHDLTVLPIPRRQVQELTAEAAQLKSRVAELQEQLQADRRASKEALEQVGHLVPWFKTWMLPRRGRTA